MKFFSQILIYSFLHIMLAPEAVSMNMGGKKFTLFKIMS